MSKTRKQALFEIQKRIAEAKGEPFPYSSYEEMEAGFALKHQEWIEYASQEHKWLEDDINDEIFYNFTDPVNTRFYTLHLHHGTYSEFWSADLSYCDETDHSQSLVPLLHGCYEYEDLPYLKIDLIRCLEVLFPAVSGWNDEFKKHGKEKKTFYCSAN